MPKQYTAVMSAMEVDCVSLNEKTEVKSEYTLFGGRSLALFTRPRRVTLDVQAR